MSLMVVVSGAGVGGVIGPITVGVVRRKCYCELLLMSLELFRLCLLVFSLPFDSEKATSWQFSGR